MKRYLQPVLMEEANSGEGEGGNKGGGEGEGTQEPNAGWEKDENLDDKGNPKDKPPKKKDEEEKPNENTDEGTQEKPDVSTPVSTQVENLVTAAGLDPAEVAKLVNENQGKLTPALMKALVDKHGEAVASIVADQLSGFYKTNSEKATKRDEAVFSQVAEAFTGITEQTGKETWGELAAWAKKNVPSNERAEINNILAQGGMATKLAVTELITRFKESDSFVQQAELLTGDASAVGGNVKPISRTEYTNELRKLEANGHVYGKSQEMAVLDKRRAAGMSRNI